jgi:paraquat-inducible protein B
MNKTNPTVIGAFVVGAVVLIIVGLLLFGGGDFWQTKVTYVLYFPTSTNGLNVGAPVKFNGVQVGQVDRIVLLMERDQYRTLSEVYISGVPGQFLEVVGGVRQAGSPIRGKAELQALIDHGLRASLQTQSMVTGQLYIELGFQPETPVTMWGLNRDYPEIPTAPSAMSQVFTGLQEAVAKLGEIPLQHLIEALIALVQHTDELLKDPSVEQVIPNVNQLLTDAGGLVAQARENEPKTFAKLNRTLDMAHAAMEAARTALVDGRTLLQHVDRQVEPLSVHTQEALVAARRALDRAATAMAALQDTAVPTLQEARRALAGAAEVMQPDSPLLSDTLRALNELNGAARAIRVLAEYLQRHPESLLRGKSR